VDDQEARPRRSRRIGWPTLVLWGLAAFGAITLVQFVVGIVFSLTRLLLLVGIIAVAVVFFRGPPDGRD
jgi:hypothetical protein